MALPEYLCSPVDHTPLTEGAGGALQSASGDAFPAISPDGTDRRIPDLRALDHPCEQTVSLEIPTRIPDEETMARFQNPERAAFQGMTRNEMRERYNVKLSSAIQYYLQQRGQVNRHLRILDIGCGNGGARQFLRDQGFDEPVLVDEDGPAADYYVDAHRLPFKDQTFDVILSLAVLEHLQFPFVAMSEIARVLKPGGALLATVSFWERWHADSCFHFTPGGVWLTCQQSGLELKDIWSGWGFIASCGCHAISGKHSAWWYWLQEWFDKRKLRKLGPDALRLHRLRTSGAFGFYAVKPVIGDNPTL